ncbi:unnamed protein product [Rhizoctonia solani]|uniref:Uncharacterized protein n=1 Tax=Rhizoctonia solani TaxID=456999 RepID=A0A8H2X6L2_9AGAM|nr:unnamed protein product [Rhizoctonia solani]
MFEYLSFLRPPPEACPLGQAVTFVPQIANDLRTEPCETEHNIYFSWQSDSGALHRGGFTKLTTWKPGSTSYKPLNVALPKEARPGDTWRLCLAVNPDSKNLPHCLFLDLTQPEFGRLPFPVTSLPISVLAGESRDTRAVRPTPSKQSKAKPKPTEHNVAKQEKIERLYSLPLNWGTLRITEQTSFDLDKVSFGVLIGALLEGFDRNVSNIGQGNEGKPGPVLRARILATDLSSAIDLIDHNRLSNSHLFDSGINAIEGSEETYRTCRIELHASELDWDNPIPASVWDKDHMLGLHCPFDIIVMADVTYNTASFGALLDTLAGLLKGPSGSGSSPIVLLAYKCRDPEELTLWENALARGISFVRVDTVRGVREPAVEIWLGGWEQDVRSFWSDTCADR